MKMGDLAGRYMRRYENSDVEVVDVKVFDVSGFGDSDGNNPVAFDLSDGTHWLADNNDDYQIAYSMTDVEEIGWNDWDGWVIVENGVEMPIEWLD